jgi:radical SAM superfamily enzyme YgiQ (UPF0313 family)
MNILLVSPEFAESFWSLSRALRIIKRKSLLPPLGLLTVAAMLPKDWAKRLVDMNIEPLTDDDLDWADYVFLGGLTIQWDSTVEVIARCKARGTKTVAGGPLLTSAYALFQDVDHFVLNEAELTMPTLVADLEAGTPRRIYRSRELADLWTTPVPMWSLAKLDAYAVAGIQYGRGCPFDCDFCTVTATLGRYPRVKEASQIIAELDALSAAGWRDRVFFVDDNLIGNKPKVLKELLPSLISWQNCHPRLPLMTQVSLNLADDARMTAAMVEAGFDTVFIGIESPDTASLEECSKKQNCNRDMVADIKKLQRAGLEVQGGFIVGFDHDTADVFQQQIDFITESGIVTAMVGQLQAAPGTRLKHRLAIEGRLQRGNLGHNTDGSTNFMPTMGLDVLRDGHARILEDIFDPPAYYQRIRTLLREMPDPAVSRKLSAADFKALGRAMIALGVVGAERREYWRLLGWTMRYKRSLLALAVRLAAIGHHHRHMTEKVLADLARSQEAPIAVAIEPSIATPVRTGT